MDWIQISRWEDLQRFGINALTGESDPFGMRLLCDLNKDGVENLADYFGVQPDLFGHSLRRNWNSTVAGEPAIASILLQKDILLPLAKWLLFSAAGVKYIVDDAHCIYGTDNEEYARQNAEALKTYERAYAEKGKTPDYSDFKPIYKVLHNRNWNGGAADRNEHQMTGRTE